MNQVSSEYHVQATFLSMQKPQQTTFEIQFNLDIYFKGKIQKNGVHRLQIQCVNTVSRKCEYGVWKSQVMQKSQVTSRRRVTWQDFCIMPDFQNPILTFLHSQY